MRQPATVLVTGGAGYIGSHTAFLLEQAGYHVVIVDSLAYGHRDLVESVLKADLIVGDISDRPLLDSIFQNYSIDAVVHFAAFVYVGESVTEPRKYYRNNVVGTLTLMEAMVDAGIKSIVFSSTCATYGIPESIPITENQAQHPINPYGASKLMIERILADFDRAYDLRHVIFRYFNAAGAHPKALLGEDHVPETHLIPLVLQTALGHRDAISVFGTDYPTPDGTCIRDYIHVMDLAQAHVLGVEYLLQNGRSDVFNLSNGNGFSVHEVIQTACEVTGKPIPVEHCPRRPGDPPILIGSQEKAKQVLGWQVSYPNLSDIIQHAWNWHQKRH